MKVILEQPNVNINAQTHLGYTPLFFSLKTPLNEEIILALLEAGCDVNITNNEGISPLHLAAARPDPHIAKLLIDRGANVNVVDFDGYTPLHEAIVHNRMEIVCMLLYYDADVNLNTEFMATPLILSLRAYSLPEIIELIMDYTADVNVLSGEFWPALYYALQGGTTRHCEELILRGSDVNYVNPRLMVTNFLEDEGESVLTMTLLIYNYIPLFVFFPNMVSNIFFVLFSIIWL